jgi:hypothetical protein
MPTNKQYANALRSAASALEHGRYSTAIKKLNKVFGDLQFAKDKKLPAAPPTRSGDLLNEDRAAWAMRALTQFANDTEGGEMDNALSDLLGDLMHACNLDVIKQDFDNELERARQYFREELAEDPDVAAGATVAP